MEATSQSYLTVTTADGQEKELRTLDVFRAFRPNRLTALGRRGSTPAACGSS